MGGGGCDSSFGFGNHDRRSVTQITKLRLAAKSSWLFFPKPISIEG
jgi:hypothetical protein